MTRPIPALAAMGPALAAMGMVWAALAPLGAQAQVQTFILGPGSNVGAETQVKPKDCVTGPDGSITCNTQLVNPPGTTQARPQYSPWDK
jgi:hypothetical protein